MATVYDRIQNFEKSHWFRFNQKHKMFVGAAIKRYWNQTDASIKDHPKFVLSVEPEGTFDVPNYPDYFTSIIDSIIVDYVLRMTTRKNKKNTEKPADQKLSKTKTSGPPEKRKRKRIPVQQKPAFQIRKNAE